MLLSLSRRSALRLGLGAAAVGSALLSARGAIAKDEGNYEAMLLYCIDPRFVTNTAAYMDGAHLKNQYSQFVFAGGPIGAVAPKFASWHQTFWDNLDVSAQLHRIKKVIALSHRDCGAAAIAYGEAAVATPEAETSTHTKALQEFRAQCSQKQPKLAVVTGIMALDGSVLVVG
jgi:hypothetical protein